MTAAQLVPRRNLLFAETSKRVRAASVKWTAGGRRYRTWHASLQSYASGLRFGVWNWDGRKKRFGIGMIGPVENEIGRTGLADVAEIHDHDLISQIADNAKVMTNEKQTGLIIAL